jgi:hypothetical protein
MTRLGFTICAINYLSKALVLFESFNRHNSSDDFVIVLIGRKKDIQIKYTHSKLKILWADELNISSFNQLAFKYDVIEFSTCIKPMIMKDFIQKYDVVMYIDPDIKIYSSFEPLYNDLQTASIALTPHSMTPIDDGCKPGDVELLRFGAYNLGFVAVKKSDDAIKFVNWWSDRLFDYCFYEPQAGMAVDQKWVDLAPAYFNNVKILKDPGYNVAFWNLHERKLSIGNDNITVNGSTPLKFIHFSSFNAKNPAAIANKQSRFAAGSRPDFIAHAEVYAKDFNRLNTGLDATPYCYDTFEDGTPISPTLRRFYATSPMVNDKENPFANNSAARRFGEKNGLMSKKVANRQIFKDASGASFQRINSLFIFMLKIGLKILGPDRYFLFLRYLGHISATKNQTGMFKNTEGKV